MSPAPSLPLKKMANALRVLSMDSVQKANSGHPGLPMGMADVATVLFSQFLKFSPQDPQWPDRDRFILSAGHGSMLLYSLLHLTGYPFMTLEQLKNFRQKGSLTPGHPEVGHTPGVETTTGPLGQGLANGVGMALGEKILSHQWSDSLINHFTYVLVGDGCLMEGISQEAISFAGHMKLGKLIVLFDDNGISIDGPTSLSTSDQTERRFQASGWQTISLDGHNFEEIKEALEAARKDPRPSLLCCRTQIGYGAPTKGGTAAVHGSPLGEAEIQAAREFLEWDEPPFIVPSEVQEVWQKVGQRHEETRQEWERKFSSLSADQQQEFRRRLSGELPASLGPLFQTLKEKIRQGEESKATRSWSQKILEEVVPQLPELIGGSADLTPSNNTKTSTMKVISPPFYEGNYLHYGIREHGMGAIMNGLARHGGFIPYGGTFLVFSDYLRPALRLSSLMNQRVIYVLTHDSIGLGEDGPTHQPVEHLASLRAIPNLLVFRPADGVETTECWELALQSSGPSVLALTRQEVPLIRKESTTENLCQKGAYILWRSHPTKRDITFLATGSEVSLALGAAQHLQEKGIHGVVVSMPCWRLFDQTEKSYKEEVLGEAHLPRLGLEAACSFGWGSYLGDKGVFLGVETFGSSAPASQLYEMFGLTAENILKVCHTLFSL